MVTKQGESLSYLDEAAPGERAQERLQLIETLKAPIIQLGRTQGYEVIENYDLGAGPIHVAWRFKADSESLPDMKLGFVVPTDAMAKEITDSIQSMPDRSLLQLRKYVTVLTPSTLVSKSEIEGARERDNIQTGEVI